MNYLFTYISLLLQKPSSEKVSLENNNNSNSNHRNSTTSTSGLDSLSLKSKDKSIKKVPMIINLPTSKTFKKF